MMLFGSNPKELTKAFAVYGAAAPAGGTAGVFLGGVLTEWASWPWVFYINIPIALVALALTPRLMPGAPARRGSVDVLGAITVTAGLALIVFGIVRAPADGWASSSHPAHPRSPASRCWPRSSLIQARRREPLMRLGILADAEPRRRQRRPVPARRGLDPDVVLPQPLPAAGPRLRRVRRRRGAAADDRRDHGR